MAVSLKITCLTKRGPNFWKMNNSYLNNINNINLINETIDKCSSEYSSNTSNQTLWDYCKVLIKEKSILYAPIKLKERKNTLFKLEN